MRRIPYLTLSGLLVFIFTFLIIYSCSKKAGPEQITGIAETDVPERLLQAAKDWQNLQTKVNNTGSLSISTSQTHIVLPPAWKEAKLQTLSNGDRVIVVPSPVIKLSVDCKLGVIRKFVFQTQGARITDGKIIEIYGYSNFIATNKNDFLEHYNNNQIGNFNGNVISYDLNYRYNGSQVFVNGSIVSGSANIGKTTNQNTISTTVDTTGIGKTTRKVTTDAITTIDAQSCWEVYEYWYQNGIYYEEPLYYYCEADGNELGGGGSSGAGGNGGPDAGIKALMKDTSSLTVAQKNALQNVLQQVIYDCIGSTLVSYLSSTMNGTMNFTVNSGYTVPAAYNPITNTMIIQNPSSLQPSTLLHELFHKYQNNNINGGTAQYANVANLDGSIKTYTPGAANIEFETKLFVDMTSLIQGQGFALTINGDNYFNWLENITNNGTEYPRFFTATQMNQYKLYLADFVNPVYATGYQGDIPNFSLAPSSMFNLITSSPCPNYVPTN